MGNSFLSLSIHILFEEHKGRRKGENAPSGIGPSIPRLRLMFLQQHIVITRSKRGQYTTPNFLHGQVRCYIFQSLIPTRQRGSLCVGW